MATKIEYKELYKLLQDEMLQKSGFKKILQHPNDIGNNFEKCWLDWFRTYLPKRYTVDKATVIDCYGNASDQIDIVVYDSQYTYLVFKENDITYIPAESVYAVFEVKQKLTKSDIEYAGRKAKSVRLLNRTSAPIVHAGGTFPPKEKHRIISGIMTVDYAWENAFGESFKKAISSMSSEQGIDCGCILNGGAFYYDGNKSFTSVGKEEALVYFFLTFVKKLQNIGTAPAIQIEDYMSALSIIVETIEREIK